METSVKIFAACTNGNVEVVQQLIASGLDINEPHFSTQGTPLHLASIAGKRRVVKLLLSAPLKVLEMIGCVAEQYALLSAAVGRKAAVIAVPECPARVSQDGVVEERMVAHLVGRVRSSADCGYMILLTHSWWRTHAARVYSTRKLSI